MVNIYESKGNDKKDEEQYFKKNKYIGKNLDFKLIISKNLTDECSRDKNVPYAIQKIKKPVLLVDIALIMMKKLK